MVRVEKTYTLNLYSLGVDKEREREQLVSAITRMHFYKGILVKCYGALRNCCAPNFGTGCRFRIDRK